jgi:ICP0-binding domain of Ubiquitin-specific protease 7
METAQDIWHPTVTVLPKRIIPTTIPAPPPYDDQRDLHSQTSSGHSSQSLSNGDIELETTNGTHDQTEWPEVGKSQGVYSTRHDAAMILIFLKWFDVESQRLKGQRPIYVNRNDKTGKLTPIIAEMMEWNVEQGEQPVNIAFFEEIKPGMIEPLKPNATFVASEIQDGDIICFMRALPPKRYPFLLYSR